VVFVTLYEIDGGSLVEQAESVTLAVTVWSSQYVESANDTLQVLPLVDEQFDHDTEGDAPRATVAV
jgi:hypothetical protein